MMGPLHDMMQSVPKIAEETRRTNDLLRDFKDFAGRHSSGIADFAADAGSDP
jgi:hypothetical protein